MSNPPYASFLSGGGEMGARMRAKDWSATPLGAPPSWPQSLKTAVRIMLTSRQPMFVWWGRELINLYNDAYKAIVGGKHPDVLGQPATVVWREIWDQVGPRAESAMTGDLGTYDEALLLIMERNGYPEETYYTFSYSPVPNDDGGVGGILCANTDDTQRIVGERQLALLRELAATTAEARTFDEACRRSAACIGANPHDVPFALIYLFDAERERLVLAGSCGIDGAHDAARPIVALDDPSPWPFATVMRAQQPRTTDLTAIAGLPTGPWPRAPRQGVVVPIAATGHAGLAGVLVAGLNPYRLFDERYRRFVELIAAQIGASIANAQAYEHERRRAETLAELDRAKTAFFSNVSHEFRTPLTLLLGPLEDLLDRSGSAADNREQLTVMHRNALRLLKLVNTLLDFARIEAGRTQAVYAPTDLAAFTSDLASVFRAAIEKADMRLSIRCPTLSQPVMVDRDMWEKIVLNLVSNAFKYTLQGEIDVSLAELDGSVELIVRDTGIGVPETELPKLFNRFHRVQGARGRTDEGTGIGLALVQELARLHGGTVLVESTVGVGSTFRVRVPLGDGHLPADRIGGPRTLATTSTGPEAFVEEALRWLPDDLNDRPFAASAPATHVPTATLDGTGGRPRILVADDNADMRDYLRRLLTSAYDVVSVGDGQAAREVALVERPDLVLTDVMMPNLDGFGLLAGLRADPRTATVPVIMLSARAGEEARVEGMLAGADDYLVKPFSARELLARVSGALALANARREAANVLRESEARFRAMADEAPVMIWVTEVDGSCSFLSKTWYAFTGQTPETGLGSGWLDAVHPVDRQRVADAFTTARAASAAFQSEYRLRRHDGVYRWALDAASPRCAADGTVVGHIGSVIDITERKQAEQQHEQLLSAERAARAAAERINRMKDEFLATVSHELRTPLHAILGWAQVLAADPKLEADTKERLAAIERNARAQAQMIEDLLDLSRMISGKLRLDVQRVWLARIVEDAVQSLLPAAESKGIRLIRVVDPKAGPVAGDPDRLQQVVWNLVSNAIKFTARGGRVQVLAERVNSHVSVTVTDTGEGIAPDFLPFLFDRFRQADGSTTRRYGGLGLGLGIVKELVELHGGIVRAASEGKGRGATFTVDLPLMATTLSTVEATDEPRHLHTTGVSPEAITRPRLEGLTVLVVDDELDARTLVGQVLEECGATILGAGSADEALDLVRRHRPSLLVSDIGMPGRDGYDLIRAIRQLPADRGGLVPAIALTAYARSDDRQRALRSGYHMHVAKPVERGELLTVCASLTGRLSQAEE